MTVLMICILIFIALDISLDDRKPNDIWHQKAS
jgi:hypothetical protein